MSPEQDAIASPTEAVPELDVTANAFQHKAALSRDEAVEVELDASESDPVPDWNERDLSALLGHLTRHGCSKEAVNQFSHLFEGTTTDDIMALIEAIRSLDRQASRNLFCSKDHVFRYAFRWDTRKLNSDAY